MRICEESYSKPRHHHQYLQISGSNAKPSPYHHFPCLFGGLWYLMNPYRGHTVLVHMSCYHTGPFPRAPTGRVCSQGTACQVSQPPTVRGKMQCGQEKDCELGRGLSNVSVTERVCKTKWEPY